LLFNKIFNTSVLANIPKSHIQGNLHMSPHLVAETYRLILFTPVIDCDWCSVMFYPFP
jgi:hypothetical protein